MSKTIVSINTVNYGSTGTVMRGISADYREKGWDAYCAYGRYHKGNVPEKNDIIIGSKTDVNLHYLYARVTNRSALGPASRRATCELVKRLEELSPDLIHLHNLHGYYINIEVLFDYLCRSGVPVRWTLHDCWAFTGHCGHFTYAGCSQWKTHCGYFGNCPQTHTVASKGLLDSCKYNFDRKRELFCSLEKKQLDIITPSKWLADLVNQSFLSGYPVRVVHNKIDKSVFKPTPSDFRERYGVGSRFMILGVASVWTERKGLNDFLRLTEDLESDKYVVVMIGLDRKQLKRMPKQMIALPKTNSAEELAEAYTAADVFVHPGIEETYGMVVAEAQACGTHVVVVEESACAEIAGENNVTIIEYGYEHTKNAICKLSRLVVKA